MILAIDPGNEFSAYVVLDKNLKPICFEKIKNEELREKFFDIMMDYPIKNVAIEMIACYGMAVGKTVFDTCIFIGQLKELALTTDVIPKFIYRKEEKMNLCHTMKAKDSNVSQALRDRFGEKGTKKNKGWFYGFKADVWQAYAVGVTYHDLYIKK